MTRLLMLIGCLRGRRRNAGGAGAGHRADAESCRRRHPSHPGGRRRRGAPLHGVALRQPRRLASDPPRAAHLHPLRQCDAASPCENAGRRAHAADLRGRTDHDRALPARRGPLLRVPPRQRRRRIRPALSLRPARRPRHAHQRRRPLAEQRRRLEQPRRPPRLHDDAQKRSGSRRPRHRPGESSDRPARVTGDRWRLGGSGLVARRLDRCWFRKGSRSSSRTCG